MMLPDMLFITALAMIVAALGLSSINAFVRLQKTRRRFPMDTFLLAWCIACTIMSVLFTGLMWVMFLSGILI